MKRYKIIAIFALALFSVSLSSCLRMGFEDIENFTGTDITGISFEYRYQDTSSEWIDGSYVVQYESLTTTSNIDTDSKEVTVTITVPDASGTFTEAERAKVALTNLVCKTSITTAACIAPVGDSPELGVPGDFSTSRKYLITSANGNSDEWTITVSALNK
jgi:hypothetical protein